MADDDGNSTSQSSVPSQSSNLYLVTFLATLFLLLFVSCAIVLRSFVLRRRYNRRLQEAMAQGIFLSPRAQGSKRKRFGARPGFVERWVEPAGGAGWARTMPLYAQPVYVKRRVRDRTSISNGPNGVPSSPVAASGTTPTVPHPPQQQPGTTRGLLNALPSLHFRRPRIDFLRRLNGLPARDAPRRASENANGNAVVGNGIEGAGAGSPAAPPGYKIRIEMMQVVVLIAMPDARKPAWKTHAGGKASFDTDFDDDRKDLTEEEEEEEPVLPELVFGLTRVAYRQTKDKVPAGPTAPTTVVLAPLDLATGAPPPPNPNSNSNSTPNTPAPTNTKANTLTLANSSNTPAQTQGRTQGRTRARAPPQDQSQTSTDQMNLVEALQTASQKEREREGRGRRQTAVEVYESLVAAAAAAEGGNAHTHSAGGVSPPSTTTTTAASHARGPHALVDFDQDTGLDPDDEEEDGVEVDLDLELQEDGVIVSETEPEDDMDLDGEGEAYVDSEADVEAALAQTIRAP